MRLGLGIGFELQRGSSAGVGAAIDKTPAAFVFTDQTDVPVSDVRTSNEITVTGTNESTAVSITGGTYSRNGGAYTAAAGTAFPGDTFTVRHTSSASNSTAINTVLTIGGISDTFTSTTEAAGDPYGPELVTNGDMSSSTGWTLEGDVPPSIAAGKLSYVGTPDGGGAGQNPTLTAGTYHTVFTVDSITDGSILFQLGNGTGALRTTAGTFTEDIVVADAGDGSWGLTGITDGTIQVDNVSIKRVL